MIKRHHMSGHTSKKRHFSRTQHIKVIKNYYPEPLKTDVYKRMHPVPQINLKGFWLKEAGFPINAPIKIQAMNECMVITIDHDRPMPKQEMSNDMEYRYLFIDALPGKHQAPILGIIDEWIEQYKKVRS